MKRMKADRKKALETDKWAIGSALYKADFCFYNAQKIQKDQVVIHVFDADEEAQKFAIGTVTRKNKKSCWVKYAIDNTEFKHNLAEKDYLNYWAFGTPLTSDEAHDALGQSQPSA